MPTPTDHLQSVRDFDTAIWQNVFDATQPENAPGKPDKPVGGKWVYSDTGSNIGTAWRFKD
jgi:hypothetical protein